MAEKSAVVMVCLLERVWVDWLVLQPAVWLAELTVATMEPTLVGSSAVELVQLLVAVTAG